MQLFEKAVEVLILHSLLPLRPQTEKSSDLSYSVANHSRQQKQEFRPFLLVYGLF
jgi:hypothetical protein